MKPQLIRDYVQPGQVLFEYRDLAFLGDESVEAAEAALCANDQGKFWDMHDAIFYNQVDEGGHDNGAFHRERLDRMAEMIDLDMTEFSSCMDENSYEEEIAASAEEAGRQGIQSTPSFVINGQLVAGGTYENIRTAIQSALTEGN